ncbi:MAG: MucR family transcriptional regulator [Rhodospirillaceae bacterium]
MSNELAADFLALTSQIVSAFVTRNSVQATDLPGIIFSVHTALKNTIAPPQATEVAEPQKPAVPVIKSVGEDFIICLEDGKKLKMLKRHLMSTYRMTPDEYRAKWNLPSDYPMVAPAYAAARSKLAKDLGLGKGGAGRKKAA